MANIHVVDLAKHYRRGGQVIHTLDGVTLDIDTGDFVAVVGRSASGKTTMLDLMGFLRRPTSGSLFIDDIDTPASSATASWHVYDLAGIVRTFVI